VEPKDKDKLPEPTKPDLLLDLDLHKHLKEQRPDLSDQQIRELLGEHGE
jgi:hypothetical protein